MVPKVLLLVAGAIMTLTHVLHYFLAWWVLLGLFLVIMYLMWLAYIGGLHSDQSSRETERGCTTEGDSQMP